MSIKVAEKIQVWMTAIKLLAAGIIVAGGIYSLSKGIYSPFYKLNYIKEI